MTRLQFKVPINEDPTEEEVEKPSQVETTAENSTTESKEEVEPVLKLLDCDTKKDNREEKSTSKPVEKIYQEKKKSTEGEGKKRSNKFFYRVSNHHELFKIGSSFYTDYLKGVKSFAIASTGYQTSQQKSILGLASFFDHKEDVKIAIVSDNIFSGAFKDLVEISKKEKLALIGREHEIEIYSFYQHFEFIDLDGLLALANNPDIPVYEEIFEAFMDHYDVIFWDIPELHKIKIDAEKYFPVIMKFESLTIIASRKITTSSDIEEVKAFFLGYGINLKGLLFDINTAAEEDHKKSEARKHKFTEKKNQLVSWWRRFFSK